MYVGGAVDDVLGGAPRSADATNYSLDAETGLHCGNDYTGGTVNDRLRGGYYADVYHYARGDGQDLIMDNGYTTSVSYNDKIELNGIDHDQLWFERLGDGLVISVIGTDDKITVNKWYADKHNRIALIESSDGMSLTNGSLDQLVSAMVVLSPPSSGELTLPGDLQEELQPVLATAWQAA